MRANKYLLSVFFSSFFVGIILFVTRLRNNFVLSEQELDLWNIFSSSMESDQGHKIFLSHAPLSFFNLMGPLLKLVGSPSFLAPLFFSIALFCFLLFMCCENIVREKKNLLSHLVIFLLFISHPYALWVLTMRPLDITLIYALYLFTRGELIANGEDLGRGVLMMGISTGYLVLSGSTGIAFAFVLFLTVPMFLKSPLFTKATWSGHLILMFPALAAITGMFYLSWLFNKSLDSVIFNNLRIKYFHFDAIYWTPFLATLFFIPFSAKKSIVSHIFSQKVLITVVLTYCVQSIMGRGYDLEAILGLAAIGLAFDFLNKNKLKPKYFLLALIFTSLGWSIQLQHPLPQVNNWLELKPYVSVDVWHEINNQVKKYPKQKVMILSEKHAAYTLGILKKEHLITPLGPDFKFRLQQDDFRKVDYLVVELPTNPSVSGNFIQDQKKYFSSPPAGLKLVKSFGNWRIFSRLISDTLKARPQRPPGGEPGSPFFPLKDAIYAGILLVGLIFLRVYYLQSPSK